MREVAELRMTMSCLCAIIRHDFEGGYMFRIIVNAVLACSMLQAGLASAQSATDRPAVQKQIAANEKAVMDAILQGDAKTFHSYVLPDSFAMSGEGVIKVADFDKMMDERKTACKFTKGEHTESTFYWVNESTVVHIYKATIDGACNGQAIPPVWSSSVWTNKGGKWLGAFHHESEVVTQPAAIKK
jgi:hypothetical protein